MASDACHIPSMHLGQEHAMGKQHSRHWSKEDWPSTGDTSGHQQNVTLASLIEPDPTPIMPHFDAGNFRAHERIDNPYFPLLRGLVYTYGVIPDEPDGDVERNDVLASFENRMIA